MKIGDLTHRITIQYSTRVADGMGGWVISWLDAGTVYAAIWPVSANEIIQAQAPTMVVTHRIRIRYRNVMKAGWRISWAGRYFNIVSIVDTDMKHCWLDLMCKEAAG